MSGKALLAALLTLGTIGASAGAGTIEQMRRAGVLNVCASDHALPFSADDAATPGVHLELARMLAAQLGLDLEVSWVLFRYQARYTGCDAFMGVAVLPESEGFIRKTEPFMDIETLAVTRPGRSLKTLDDLDGLRVATPAASVAHMALVDRPIEIAVSYVGDGQILDAVRTGQADVGLVTNTGLGWYLKNHADADLESHATEFIHEMNGYPMAIGLRNSNQATADLVNQALRKLRAQGALDQLFAKYGLSGTLR
jgi:polar amino acid transport system substrate-binding protein